MLKRFRTKLRRWVAPAWEPVIPNSVISPDSIYGSWSRGFYPAVYPVAYKKPASGGSDNRQLGTKENASHCRLYHL